MEHGPHETREHRVGQRLGAIGQPVEDDPAAQCSADYTEQRYLRQSPLHDRLAPGVEDCPPDTGREGHSQIGDTQHSPQALQSWWCGGRMAESLSGAPRSPSTITIWGPYIASMTGRVSVSRGFPKAIWRPLRQRTRSQERALCTSCVAIIRPRPSPARSSSSDISRLELGASRPEKGSSRSSKPASCTSERA